MKLGWKLYVCDDEGNKFFGKGPVRLLEKIDEHKSINKAAADMYLSYHKALKMIKDAEEGFGLVLVERKTGGRSGGGSFLTEDARKVIQKYKALEKEFESFSKNKTEEYL